MTATEPRLLTRAEVAKRLGVSVRTVETYEVSDSRFPKPLRLGQHERTIRHVETEIDRFISALLQESA